MNLDRAVFALAGTITLISVLLAAFVSTWWLLLTGFVGVTLLQSAVTGASVPPPPSCAASA